MNRKLFWFLIAAILVMLVLVVIPFANASEPEFTDFGGELGDNYAEGYYEQNSKPDFNGGEWEREYRDAYSEPNQSEESEYQSR